MGGSGGPGGSGGSAGLGPGGPGAGGLGPFEAVRGLTIEAVLPPVVHVRQTLSDAGAARRRRRNGRGSGSASSTGPARDAGRADGREPGDPRQAGRVAGRRQRPSRRWGAEPFIVPAMGSHGGATAEGQVEVLADLGITEASMGMPILATMETVVLGQLEGGPPVHLDRNAAEADGILAINRIKAHTDFSGTVESGLAKIVAIGLGKRVRRRGDPLVRAGAGWGIGSRAPPASSPPPAICWAVSASSRTATIGRRGSRSSSRPRSAVRPRRPSLPRQSVWHRPSRSMLPTSSSSMRWARTSRDPGWTPT